MTATPTPASPAGEKALTSKTGVGRCFLLAFIMTMPLINVLGPTPWTPVPLLVAIGLFAVTAPWQPMRRDASDVILCILLAVSVIPWIWSSSFVGVKTLNHTLALLSVIWLYYIVMREALTDFVANPLGVQRIIRVVYLSLVLTSAFILLEFYARNVLNLDVDSIVPYVERPEYAAIVAGGVQRSRGFAAESGHMALFFDFALLFCMSELLGKGLVRRASMVVVVLAWISLFSAASFLAVLVGGTYYATKVLRHRFFAAIGTVGAVVAVIAGTLIAFGNILGMFFESSFLPKLALLWLDPGAGSGSARFAALAETLRLVAHYPFGIGIGITPAIAAEGGTYFGHPVSAGHVSLPALFAVSGGIIGLAATLTLVAGFLIRAARLESEHRAQITAGGLALSIHYLVVGNFWFPFLWFFWALVIATQRGTAAKSS